ncbi:MULTISPECIES: DUF397 domain-containing protein [unclassified Streptomyces]|uniref:DUF397 domain-containing protein n=1 Tax=unclassified Streptomyces TaxID=2593676 RepID=UPI00278C8325|nr:MULTISPECIES: DUF397 domain-containing protein [unclassified Streptomyces]
MGTIPTTTTDTTEWRKSSYSGDDGGECVECAPLTPTAIAVRDSKNPDGPRLALSPAAFRAFVAGAARG